MKGASSNPARVNSFSVDNSAVQDNHEKDREVCAEVDITQNEILIILDINSRFQFYPKVSETYLPMMKD